MAVPRLRLPVAGELELRPRVRGACGRRHDIRAHLRARGALRTASVGGNERMRLEGVIASPSPASDDCRGEVKAVLAAVSTRLSVLCARDTALLLRSAAVVRLSATNDDVARLSDRASVISEQLSRLTGVLVSCAQLRVCPPRLRNDLAVRHVLPASLESATPEALATALKAFTALRVVRRDLGLHAALSLATISKATDWPPVCGVAAALTALEDAGTPFVEPVARLQRSLPPMSGPADAFALLRYFAMCDEASDTWFEHNRDSVSLLVQLATRGSAAVVSAAATRNARAAVAKFLASRAPERLVEQEVGRPYSGGEVTGILRSVSSAAVKRPSDEYAQAAGFMKPRPPLEQHSERTEVAVEMVTEGSVEQMNAAGLAMCVSSLAALRVRTPAIWSMLRARAERLVVTDEAEGDGEKRPAALHRWKAAAVARGFAVAQPIEQCMPVVVKLASAAAAGGGSAIAYAMWTISSAGVRCRPTIDRLADRVFAGGVFAGLKFREMAAVLRSCSDMLVPRREDFEKAAALLRAPGSGGLPGVPVGKFNTKQLCIIAAAFAEQDLPIPAVVQEEVRRRLYTTARLDESSGWAFSEDSLVLLCSAGLPPVVARAVSHHFRFVVNHRQHVTEAFAAACSAAAQSGVLERAESAVFASRVAALQELTFRCAAHCVVVIAAGRVAEPAVATVDWFGTRTNAEASLHVCTARAAEQRREAVRHGFVWQPARHCWTFNGQLEQCTAAVAALLRALSGRCSLDAVANGLSQAGSLPAPAVLPVCNAAARLDHGRLRWHVLRIAAEAPLCPVDAAAVAAGTDDLDPPELRGALIDRALAPCGYSDVRAAVLADLLLAVAAVPEYVLSRVCTSNTAV
eukprot:TRINITY_DN37296_c0_g1_i1.p1 TRINITY_DN37296_c0_g1~~TRINITY_DN37296_c0_g1_i1.p1  ORF type:complete len:881 (+),score=225.26 TRINITY_DN37296_c0_g1_i1:60-2645(+)